MLFDPAGGLHKGMLGSEIAQDPLERGGLPSMPHPNGGGKNPLAAHARLPPNPLFDLNQPEHTPPFQPFFFVG